MLGTNDLKARFSLSASDIAAGAGALVDIVQKSEVGPDGGAPMVLLVAPPPLGRLSELAEMFKGAAAKSNALSEHFQLLAEERGCSFLDAGAVIVSSDIDGVHLEVTEHGRLGRAVAEAVRHLLGT